MSVHYIHKTHMDNFDSLARKFLKIWFKIPKNEVSDVSIFQPHILYAKLHSKFTKKLMPQPIL